jgi:hypothetical protein
LGYTPRRPQASPLYRVLADHFETLERVHEERFEPTHGPLRRVARRAAGRLLDCARVAGAAAAPSRFRRADSSGSGASGRA